MKMFSRLFGSHKGSDDKKTAKAKKVTRKKITTLHLIVAVVAIIECLILISFTTFSWIETASSLKILSGKKHIVDKDPSRIPIKSALNFQYRIGSANTDTDAENCANLNTFFSECGKKLYRYAETSSADGKNFYFANPSTAQNSFRKGDTTDFNTSYTYFDFQVLNGKNGKYKYDDNTGDNSTAVKMKFEFADNDVFTVDPGTSGLTSTQCGYIRDAMRLSIQAGSGNAKIYSETAQEYDAQSGVTSGTVTSVSTTAIQQNLKVFAVAKNGTANVACRIWFEKNAPDLSGITAKQLAGVIINVNFKLKYSNNETDFVYFDDYTFSNAKANNGGHLTEDHLDANGHETDAYRMYFVYKASSSASGKVYPMTLDTSNSNANATRWVTCASDGSPDATLPSSGDTTSVNYYKQLTEGTGTQYSYFAYGSCPLNALAESEVSNIYTWRLNNPNNSSSSQTADPESELVYNAFGMIQTASGNSNYYGAGGWVNSTPLSMVYFRDMATGLTNQPYNTGDDNFKYITKAVNVAADTTENENRNNVLYVSYDGEGENTIASSQYGHTASMYYDKSLDGGKGLFKAWVPSYWLEAQDNTKQRTFRYCPHDYYSNCVASWSSPQPTKSVGADDYIYTALGSWEQYTTDYYDGEVYSDHGGYITQGTGTWKKIEQQPVYLSAELIDNYMKPDYRFQICITLDGVMNFVSLVPDETNTKFFAYIPDLKDGNPNSNAAYGAGDISFRAFTYGGFTPGGVYQAPSTEAVWTPAYTRNGSNIFYPVKFEYDTSTDTSTNIASVTPDTSRGFWHVSVIVDGTYEHLFWKNAVYDTRPPYSELSPAQVLGNFKYNTTGHPDIDDASAYDNITAYSLDEYRWYVPMEDAAAYIYYRWEPYSGTVLKFNHNTNDGIYCVVTEGKNDVPELYDARYTD
jgi:hypothetical protein